MTRDSALAHPPADPAVWRAAPEGEILISAEIHVFAFTLDLPETRVHGLQRLLSDDEQARSARFWFARDRQRYIVGRARMRAILARHVNVEPADLQFRYGSHGKPGLVGEDVGGRIRFSLSRSAGLGIMAVQLDEELGVDVERVRPFMDALPVAERLFAPDESRELQRLPDVDRSAAFFRYWTRKEAIGKSLGLGLSYPMDAFTLARGPSGPPERLVVAGDHGTVTRWSIPLPEPCEGYVAALATAGSLPVVKCWTWPDHLGEPRTPASRSAVRRS